MLRLTPRPAVPVLVRAAALGALALAGCGSDDDGGSSSSGEDDVHPTAGPCAHDPSAPGCEETGSGGSTSGAETTQGAETTFDSFPTVPCVHDPDAPECETGSDSGSDSSATGTSTGTT